MPRPFDTRYRRHGGTLNENAGENEDAKVLERSVKNRGLSKNTNKPEQLLRTKNVNQVTNQQRLNTSKEKGKQSIDGPKKPTANKEQSRTSLSLKRPVSEGNLPIPKRADIEHCFSHEEELPYVPDDIDPLDLDLFDSTINMTAYETTSEQLADYDTPLQELESFRTTTRQFQQVDPTIDDARLSPTFSLVDDKDDSLEDVSFALQPLNDEPSIQFPSEIEFCPSPEEELPFDPELDQGDLSIDLSVFTPGVNISAYDVSKDFDKQVEFSDDLFDDEDLGMDLAKVSSLMKDHGVTFSDLSIFFDPATMSSITDALYDHDEQEIDYDEIPFSNHIAQELPLVN